MKLTDIVIPTYKESEDLITCVRSIYKYTNKFNLILPCSPFGQVKNINYGLDKSKSKFVAILDWDVEVSKDWLDQLIDSFEDDIGIMGAKMIGQYAELGGLNGKAPAGVNDWKTLAGGCMVFRNIGLRWDENFSSGYWADTDFCRQFKEKGYRVCINGDVIVKHNTKLSNNPDMPRLMAEGEAIYNQKWRSLEY